MLESSFFTLLSYALTSRHTLQGQRIDDFRKGTNVLWVWMFFFVFCRWLSTTTNQNQRCCLLGQAQYSDGEMGKFTVSFSAQFVYTSTVTTSSDLAKP